MTSSGIDLPKGGTSPEMTPKVASSLSRVKQAVSAPSAAVLRGVIAEGIVRTLTAFVVAMLVGILGTIVYYGAGSISWEFLSQVPRSSSTGFEGGIFPALFGTAFVIVFMILMALPLGVMGAIFLAEYTRGSFFSRVIRAGVNNLAGVPSIVFGLFGLGFFVLFVGRFMDSALLGEGRRLFGQGSMFWAAATLAVLVLPVIIVATEEALRAVPESLREAAYGLGATKWQVIWNVVLPQARSGILTGGILAISRGAGELAPVLFVGVAAFKPDLPLTGPVNFGLFEVPVVNPFESFMHLNYMIYTLATQSVDPVATRPAQFGTTLVLVALTFILNLTAIVLRIKYSKRGGH